MKIAIVTYYAVTNIGDKILTETLAYLVERCGHSARIVDIQGRYPFRFRGILGIVEKLLARMCKGDVVHYFERKFNDVDIIVFGGGEIVSTESINVNRNIKMCVEIAERKGCAVYFNAIGVRSYPQCVDVPEDLRYAFRSPAVKSISVRESPCEFVRHFVPARQEIVKWSCDTAVWCGTAYKLKRLTCATKIKKIGFNIITPEIFSRKGISSDFAYEYYRKLVTSLISSGFEVTLFTNGVPREMEIAQKIQKDVGTIRVSTFNGCKSFLRLLLSFDGIVSTHLHTSICSYSLGVPTIALTWSDKIDSFYESIGSLKYCVNMSKVPVNGALKLMLSDWNATMYNNVNRTVYDRSIFTTPFFELLNEGVVRSSNL